MPNLYSLFKELVPTESLMVGNVSGSVGDLHTVTLLGGGTMTAMGKAQAGDNVFIKGGTIQGLAPALTLELIEI